MWGPNVPTAYLLGAQLKNSGASGGGSDEAAVFPGSAQLRWLVGQFLGPLAAWGHCGMETTGGRMHPMPLGANRANH